jgi:mono/diheme cytochrome c family protein
MKNQFAIAAAAVLLQTTNVSPVLAVCQAKSEVREEIKVAIPFAVPVGVPVATFAPYFYSYQQFQAKAPELGAAQPSAPPAASNRPIAAVSVVSSRCANCHGGVTPKADLSLEHVERLTAAQRLQAIGAVASGAMPKGSTLTSDEMCTIVKELAAPSRPLPGGTP